MDDQPLVDPRRPQHIYMAIADRIAEQIADGRLQPGARLPAREELMAEFGVAKMTIARAVRELSERGLVRILIGRGTYVVGAPGRPEAAGDEAERPEE